MERTTKNLKLLRLITHNGFSLTAARRALRYFNSLPKELKDKYLKTPKPPQEGSRKLFEDPYYLNYPKPPKPHLYPGQRIKFIIDQDKSADEDSPAMTFARKGQLGTINKLWDAKVSVFKSEECSVVVDGSSNPFTALYGEDFMPHYPEND